MHQSGMRTQQLWQQQQQQQEQLLPGYGSYSQLGCQSDDPFLQSRHGPTANVEEPAFWQDEVQQQHMQGGHWGSLDYTGQQPPQRGQRRQQGMREGGNACLSAETSLDPSAVLDDFLNSRLPAAPAGSRCLHSTRVPVSRMRQNQQEQYSGAVPAAGGGWGGTPAMPATHQPQWQQQQKYKGEPPGVYAGQGGLDRRNNMRLWGDAGVSQAPWAAADVDAAGFDGFEPGGRQTGFLQVLRDDACEVGADCVSWDEGLAQDCGFDGMPGALGGMPAYGRSGRGPVRQPQGPTEPFFFEGAADVDQSLPHSVPGIARPHAQPGQTGAFGVGRGPGQHTASRSGKFATAPQGMQDLEDDNDLFAAPLAPCRQAGQRRGAAAAVALGGGVGSMQGRRQYPGAVAAAGYVGRGASGKQPTTRGFAVPTSSNTSSLSVPAFLPHHNPSKQLKYRAPTAAAAGVVKRKKGGLQTKLCWG
jgi:hypothetical protein